jgi:hypothetical protein
MLLDAAKTLALWLGFTLNTFEMYIKKSVQVVVIRRIVPVRVTVTRKVSIRRIWDNQDGSCGRPDLLNKDTNITELFYPNFSTINRQGKLLFP